MEPTAVSLDRSGRILIPSTIRRRLGLSPGMTLIVEEGDGGDVTLRVQPEQQVLVDKSGVLVVTAEPLADLAEVTRQERERRALDRSLRTGL